MNRKVVLMCCLFVLVTQQPSLACKTRAQCQNARIGREMNKLEGNVKRHLNNSTLKRYQRELNQAMQRDVRWLRRKVKKGGDNLKKWGRLLTK